MFCLLSERMVPIPFRKSVYLCRHISGSITVINIQNGYSICTGIDHGQKRRQSIHIGTVPHRRGNRKHRITHKAAYDAGQSPFHSGYSHHTIRALYHIQPGHQPMDSAHSHIIDAVHIGAEEFRCLSGLFRHRYICRPCRTYRNLPDSLLSLFSILIIWEISSY